MKAIISLGGQPLSIERFNSVYENGDYIIGVDSGCQFLYNQNIMPDLILGDFDSIEKSLLSYYKSQNIPIKIFPVIKNETDGELGFIEGSKIANELLIIGTGGLSEIDHFLGNVFLLTRYPNATIVLEEEWINVLEKGKHMVNKEKGDSISFLPLESTHLILIGFDYDGNIKTEVGHIITLRNRIKEFEAKIEILEGKMLLIQGKK
ncbi:hypothetical protein AZF37_05100 [endosymbiont 'TC1' of Trimyema compressum]|uniref:thiamine diphosphokinase n=1 Tax=endosymbiont 'TC1' of Trimyema compressum TaxID=243899 RepID=UPI0007F12851|nr:thiamine diphosphokinase [endosymbiont 'TC1' of Trimyema compressum]AMP20636.1 hypothetical protein AZF37_05100 [endosymbiont 'TC1' of Trimyema compressum]